MYHHGKHSNQIINVSLLYRQKIVTDGRTENMKTVYPPQTKFAGGIMKFVDWSIKKSKQRNEVISDQV